MQAEGWLIKLSEVSHFSWNTC